MDQGGPPWDPGSSGAWPPGHTPCGPGAWSREPDATRGPRRGWRGRPQSAPVGDEGPGGRWPRRRTCGGTARAPCRGAPRPEWPLEELPAVARAGRPVPPGGTGRSASIAGWRMGDSPATIRISTSSGTRAGTEATRASRGARAGSPSCQTRRRFSARVLRALGSRASVARWVSPCGRRGRGLSTGLPAQRGPNPVPGCRRSREPARDVLTEAARTPPRACAVMRAGDWRRNGLGPAPTRDPSGTPRHGHPTTLGIAAAPPHFGRVAVRARPGLGQIFRAGLVREDAGRGAAARRREGGGGGPCVSGRPGADAVRRDGPGERAAP